MGFTDMSSSCRDCGSSNVVRDDLYSQVQWVCEDCGSVLEEGRLTTTISDEAQSKCNPTQCISVSSDPDSLVMLMYFFFFSCALLCFHGG